MFLLSNRQPKIMKKFLLIITTIFLTINTLYAQHVRMKNLPNYDLKTWHFGFTVGVNKLNFKVEHVDNFNSLGTIYGIEPQSYNGFHLGPISSLRLCNYVDLRMMFNLSFNQRDIVFHTLDKQTKTFGTQTAQITSTVLEFPVAFKYRAARITNFSPYLIAGVNPRYDLAAGKPPKNKTAENQPVIKLEKFDPVAELGVGFDFYMQYFKLSIELKYRQGIIDVCNHDGTEYSNAIKYLKTNGFMISLHFE